MTMPRQIRLFLAAATLSAATAACAAQTAGQSGLTDSNSQQTEAAPIERAYSNQNNYPGGQMPQTGPAMNGPAMNQAMPAPPAMSTTTEPVAGVMLRVAPGSSVQQVSSDAQKFELRLDRGVANVNIHDPGKDKVILVDLPGGQTQLLKNGLYTFNAETNTARVLKGEALAFPAGTIAGEKPGNKADAKPIKVKEYNKVVFSGTNVRPREFYPEEARVDLLRGPRMGPGGANEPYGYGPYGDGFYGYPPYPYYGYGYPYAPWGWGYPYYAWGYPFGVGFGFGYYGGWGYRGGFGYRGGWGYRGWR